MQGPVQPLRGRGRGEERAPLTYLLVHLLEEGDLLLQRLDASLQVNARQRGRVHVLPWQSRAGVSGPRGRGQAGVGLTPGVWPHGCGQCWGVVKAVGVARPGVPGAGGVTRLGRCCMPTRQPHRGGWGTPLNSDWPRRCSLQELWPIRGVAWARAVGWVPGWGSPMGDSAQQDPGLWGRARGGPGEGSREGREGGVGRGPLPQALGKGRRGLQLERWGGVRAGGRGPVRGTDAGTHSAESSQVVLCLLLQLDLLLQPVGGQGSAGPPGPGVGWAGRRARQGGPGSALGGGWRGARGSSSLPKYRHSQRSTKA